MPTAPRRRASASRDAASAVFPRRALHRVCRERGLDVGVADTLWGFYAKHNVGKLTDIPAIMAEWQGAEEELLEALEHKYRTASVAPANTPMPPPASAAPTPAPQPVAVSPPRERSVRTVRGEHVETYRHPRGGGAPLRPPPSAPCAAAPSPATKAAHPSQRKAPDASEGRARRSLEALEASLIEQAPHTHQRPEHGACGGRRGHNRALVDLILEDKRAAGAGGDARAARRPPQQRRKRRSRTVPTAAAASPSSSSTTRTPQWMRWGAADAGGAHPDGVDGARAAAEGRQAAKAVVEELRQRARSASASLGTAPSTASALPAADEAAALREEALQRARVDRNPPAAPAQIVGFTPERVSCSPPPAGSPLDVDALVTQATVAALQSRGVRTDGKRQAPKAAPQRAVPAAEPARTSTATIPLQWDAALDALERTARARVEAAAPRAAEPAWDASLAHLEETLRAMEAPAAPAPSIPPTAAASVPATVVDIPDHEELARLGLSPSDFESATSISGTIRDVSASASAFRWAKPSHVETIVHTTDSTTTSGAASGRRSNSERSATSAGRSSERVAPMRRLVPVADPSAQPSAPRMVPPPPPSMASLDAHLSPPPAPSIRTWSCSDPDTRGHSGSGGGSNSTALPVPPVVAVRTQPTAAAGGEVSLLSQFIPRPVPARPALTPPAPESLGASLHASTGRPDVPPLVVSIVAEEQPSACRPDLPPHTEAASCSAAPAPPLPVREGEGCDGPGAASSCSLLDCSAIPMLPIDADLTASILAAGDETPAALPPSPADMGRKPVPTVRRGAWVQRPTAPCPQLPTRVAQLLEETASAPTAPSSLPSSVPRSAPVSGVPVPSPAATASTAPCYLGSSARLGWAERTCDAAPHLEAKPRASVTLQRVDGAAGTWYTPVAKNGEPGTLGINVERKAPVEASPPFVKEPQTPARAQPQHAGPMEAASTPLSAATATPPFAAVGAAAERKPQPAAVLSPPPEPTPTPTPTVQRGLKVRKPSVPLSIAPTPDSHRVRTALRRLDSNAPDTRRGEVVKDALWVAHPPHPQHPPPPPPTEPPAASAAARPPPSHADLALRTWRIGNAGAPQELPRCSGVFCSQEAYLVAGGRAASEVWVWCGRDAACSAGDVADAAAAVALREYSVARQDAEPEAFFRFLEAHGLGVSLQARERLEAAKAPRMLQVLRPAAGHTLLLEVPCTQEGLSDILPGALPLACLLIPRGDAWGYTLCRTAARAPSSQGQADTIAAFTALSRTAAARFLFQGAADAAQAAGVLRGAGGSLCSATAAERAALDAMVVQRLVAVYRA
eukprot:TRINITY_DN13444_c0_g1_i1.p1 TRINITY_DN13444_c0_g1~~TRINITY_DN13444_c0_g1_i1.p1  ORF type:complete len:1311 (+),score=259.57 TRINITY_DN13444_c0_g1_i1:81-4013(+)